jgi:hypothetical protein
VETKGADAKKKPPYKKLIQLQLRREDWLMFIVDNKYLFEIPILF